MLQHCNNCTVLVVITLRQLHCTLHCQSLVIVACQTHCDWVLQYLIISSLVIHSDEKERIDGHRWPLSTVGLRPSVVLWPDLTQNTFWLTRVSLNFRQNHPIFWERSRNITREENHLRYFVFLVNLFGRSSPRIHSNWHMPSYSSPGSQLWPDGITGYWTSYIL